VTSRSEDSRPGACWSVHGDTWHGLPEEMATLLAPPVVVCAESAPAARPGRHDAEHPPGVARGARMLVPAPPRVGRHRRRTAQPVAMA